MGACTGGTSWTRARPTHDRRLASAQGPWMREECQPGMASVIPPACNRADFCVEAIASV